jgi:hypothetical protein
VLLAALAVHLAWGLARVPTKVVARRAELIADHRRHGDVVALFDASDLGGAELVQWLRANTPPDATIAWEGAATGAIEFAAALLWPRLLAASPGPDAPGARRTFAQGTRDGRTGTLVLVAAPRSLQLEVR